MYERAPIDRVSTLQTVIVVPNSIEIIESPASSTCPAMHLRVIQFGGAISTVSNVMIAVGTVLGAPVVCFVGIGPCAFAAPDFHDGADVLRLEIAGLVAVQG